MIVSGGQRRDSAIRVHAFRRDPGVFLEQSIRSLTSNGESNGEWKSLGLKTVVVALNPLDAKLRFKK